MRRAGDPSASRTTTTVTHTGLPCSRDDDRRNRTAWAESVAPPGDRAHRRTRRRPRRRLRRLQRQDGRGHLEPAGVSDAVRLSVRDTDGSGHIQRRARERRPPPPRPAPAPQAPPPPPPRPRRPPPPPPPRGAVPCPVTTPAGQHPLDTPGSAGAGQHGDPSLNFCGGGNATIPTGTTR